MSPAEMHLLAYAVSTTTGNLHLSVCGKSPLLRWHKSLPEISSLFCLFLLHRNIFSSRKMTPRTLGEGLFSVLSKEQGTPGSAALWLPGCFPRLFFCDLLSTYWTILDKQRPSEFNPGTPNCLYGYQHQTCDHLQFMLRQRSHSYMDTASPAPTTHSSGAATCL